MMVMSVLYWRVMHGNGGVFTCSKVLLELGELFPAVEAAEQAVKLMPTWAMAWQTLGRAQVGLGEVHMVKDRL